MAAIDGCESGRRNCNGLQEQGIGRSGKMWFPFLCFMLSLPCVQPWRSETVTMYPEVDMIYVKYGDDLEIFCKAGADYSSEDLMFYLHSKPLHSETQKVNATTIRLFIKHPELSRRKTYYCKNTKSGKNALKSVVVAVPPQDVEDFKCFSKNIDILNCSWTSPDKLLYTKYTLSYFCFENLVMPCEASIVENSHTRYCVLSANSIPRYRQHEGVYNFHLEAFNKFGSRQQNFTIDHYSIVKPDPPSQLLYTNEGPHSVTLQWNIHRNIADFLRGDVVYRIEYQMSKIDDPSYFRRVDTSGLQAQVDVNGYGSTNYQFNLTDLPYAHWQYEVCISIKPVKAKEEQFWSDFTSLVFNTSSDRPRRPPLFAAGAFTQKNFKDFRTIRMYWKQLEVYEESGENFTYLVIVKQNSEIQPLFPDKNKGLGVLTLKKATLDAIEVSVWSYNEKGMSANSSSLYIPPESETRDLKISRFTKLTYENGTYELSWSGRDGIDNYTLFWCQRNTLKLCDGRLDFMSLDGKINKHVIHLPSGHRYEFALSANQGSKSSGMIWARCACDILFSDTDTDE